MYRHRYGLDVICLRILTCAERPRNVRALTWLSPDGAGRLFGCLAAPSRVPRGLRVSANTRGGWVSWAGPGRWVQAEDDAGGFAAGRSRARPRSQTTRCWPTGR
jgi:hypothetical protein